MANCPEDPEVNCKTWSNLSSFTKSILKSQKVFLELTFSGKKLRFLSREISIILISEFASSALQLTYIYT